MYPVRVAVPLLPSDRFSGVSGCRNPGVTVTVDEAFVAELELIVAVTVTCTLLAVR
jgi:hypothetical protein